MPIWMVNGVLVAGADMAAAARAFESNKKELATSAEKVSDADEVIAEVRVMTAAERRVEQGLASLRQAEAIGARGTRRKKRGARPGRVLGTGKMLLGRLATPPAAEPPSVGLSMSTFKKEG